MTHVFVVNQQTFKYHLEYLFAGTGGKDDMPVIFGEPKIKCSQSTERVLVGMIADISKIREGDNIIFYLQANGNLPGRFFGVFEAASAPFGDASDEDNYLSVRTEKKLAFRVLIRPKEVYAKGVTEHEYLDSLEGKTHPSDLCWSLIYRKLKGNRGCTMIMDYEYEDLLAKLKKVNSDEVLHDKFFSYDYQNEQIVGISEPHPYAGRQNSLNILPRLLYKATNKNAFEAHLQAYISQNFDSSLSNLLIPVPGQKCWLGNEVSCGVGMQRIDVMLQQETSTDVYIRLVELKYIAPYLNIILYQIPWYLDWISYYVVPKYKGKNIHIIPTIIAKGALPFDLSHSYANFRHPLKDVDVQPLQYIGFSINKNSINFDRYL